MDTVNIYESITVLLRTPTARESSKRIKWKLQVVQMAGAIVIHDLTRHAKTSAYYQIALLRYAPRSNLLGPDAWFLVDHQSGT